MEYAKIPPIVVAEEFPIYKKIIVERLKHKESSNTFNKMLEGVNELKSGLEVSDLEVIEVARLTWKLSPYKAEVISSSLIAPTRRKPLIYVRGFLF